MEGINNAPYGSEQSDERSNVRDRCQPLQPAFQSRVFFRAGDLHRSLYRSSVLDPGGGVAALPPILLVSAFEDRYQRTRPELLRDGSHILQTHGFPERAQEATALHAGAAV